MHELAIKEFKETELYLGLASNRFRKKIIDKGLYNEVDRLKELWYSPIKNYVPEACIEPVEPVIEENNTVEEPE